MLAIPLAVRDVIDNGFTAGNLARIDDYFWVLLAVVLIMGLFGAARQYLVTWLGERVVADIRDAVYRHVIRMDPAFYETTKIGEVLSRLTADTTLIRPFPGSGCRLFCGLPSSSSAR